MRRSDDRGSAIVTAVLISSIIFVMSLTAVTLSVHDQNSSGTDRARTQAIHAAEAGFDVAMSRLQSTAAELLPCTVTGTMSTTPAARYRVSVTYYPTRSLTTAPLICREPGGPSTSAGGAAVHPGAALITATGVVGLVERTMDGAANLTPVMGQFNKALFSDQTPTLNNNLEVVGENGEPADVYTNGNWVCPQSTKIRGSVFAQGYASLDQTCGVDEHLWVKGSLSMRNNTTTGVNAVSSQDNITLDGPSHVGSNAVSAGTCTGCTPERVAGTVSASRGIGNVPDPPRYSFPTISADTAAWAGMGFTVRAFSSCTDARSFLDATVSTPTLMRISPACSLVFANNSTVTLAADLAIITDGSITSERRVKFRSSDTTNRKLYLIVPDGTSCSSNGNIVTSNNTDFIDIDFFVYTPCVAQFANNNPSSSGQVYAGQATIQNLFKLNFKAIFVPGVPNRVVGYSTELAYLREIAS